MKKSKLLERIIEALHDSLAVLEKAARAAHAEATHRQGQSGVSPGSVRRKRRWQAVIEGDENCHPCARAAR